MNKIFFLIITLFISSESLLANEKVNTEKLPKGLIFLDNRPAPPLKLNDMDGEPFDIEKFRGKWVFVHFWATWCGPCRKEIPTIQKILNRYKDSHIKLAIINTAESEDLIFEFLGISAPDIVPLMDNDGLVTERWQPRGLPATFFVDPKGKLRYLALGGRPWDEAEYILFLDRLGSMHKNQKIKHQ